MITQQKIHVNSHNVTFVTLPPVNQLVDKLPAQLFKYHVRETFSGLEYSLEYAKSLTLPEKLFGNIEQQKNRILTAYSKSNKNLSVLLYGIGGTGKSTLAKLLAEEVINNLNLPVIIIQQNEIMHLEWLLNKLNQPVMFLVDEFEKMFESTDAQGQLLTLFDGLYNSNHLFVLTANDESRINEYFFNRPSRIRYAFKYEALPYEIYADLIKSKFESKRAEDIINQLAFVPNLSFDIVSEIMTEALNFPELSADALFENFNLNKLNLKLSYLPCVLMHDNKSLESIINGIIKKHLPECDDLKLSCYFNYEVFFDDIRNGEYNGNSNDLFDMTVSSKNNFERCNIAPKTTEIAEINHKEIALNVDLSFSNYAVNYIMRVVDYNCKESLSEDIKHELREKLRREQDRKCDLIRNELLTLLKSNLQLTFNR